MQGTRGLRLALASMLFALVAGAASAAPHPLDPADAQKYALAFEAAERGDFIDAELNVADARDKALSGHLSLRRLLHAAYKATFDDLAGWLERYADLPGAERVHALAESRRPPGAQPARAPLLSGAAWRKVEDVAQGRVRNPSSDKGRAAREAYYSGDVKRALDLAQASGERWIAGLAAYRLQNYALAESFFDQVARDGANDAWLRAGAAFWAARAAEQIDDPARSRHFLIMAARYPETFYGMIAARRVELLARTTAQGAPTGEIVPASFTTPSVDLLRFVREEPRAHRAAALAQIGRVTDAGLELRAGLTLARTPAERDRWMELVAALNGPLTTGAELVRTTARATPNLTDFPAPELTPKWGFTLDKALVYAIVRQESRFNPLAVSPAGAIGLMQLMPEAAARAAGDDKLKADMSPLFDPSFNLRVGQDYFTWLMERGVGYDLLRAVAAYNGGPSTLTRTVERVGIDDSLLVIESLPSLETRNYVEKVMASYWVYRKMFGQETPTLDALALGAVSADARLDFSTAG